MSLNQVQEAKRQIIHLHLEKNQLQIILDGIRLKKDQVKRDIHSLQSWETFYKQEKETLERRQSEFKQRKPEFRNNMIRKPKSKVDFDRLISSTQYAIISTLTRIGEKHSEFIQIEKDEKAVLMQIHNLQSQIDKFDLFLRNYN